MARSIILLPLTLIFSTICSLYFAQSVTDTARLVVEGKVGMAIDASCKPDASQVSVYMIVDTHFKYTADPWITILFYHYVLPVDIVKKTPADRGEGCSFRIYVDGRSMSENLSNGDFTMLGIKYGHKRAFPIIKSAYEQANMTNSTRADQIPTNKLLSRNWKSFNE